MVKQHSQVINFLMGICDQVVVGGMWAVSYYLRFTYFPHEKGVPESRFVLSNLLIVLLVSMIVLTSMGLYKPRRDKSFLLELGQIIKAGIMIWGVLIVLIYYTAAGPFTRGMLSIFLPLMIAALIIERGTYRSVLRFIRRRGWNLRHALIVGTGRLGQSTLLCLQRNSWTGIHVAGFIEAGQGNSAAAQPAHVRGVPIVGKAADVQEIVEQTRADCVFVALASRQAESLRYVVSALEKTPADVRIIPDLFLSRFPGQVGVSELDGLPIISLRENPLAGWPSIYKRMFDIAGASFGLMLFGLPMVVIAGAIKVSGGAVFYRQRRVGYGRRPFTIIKFRTMAADAEADGPAFAARNDPRCTRLGRWLRSTSLDELPQLFNVLKGDMSLVGPRPERPEMLERIQSEVPGFPMRLKVRAGLTGWAQVNGFRGSGDRGLLGANFRKRLQYDLYYLNNWSPLLDLRIVLATVLRGFRHPNAY